MSDSNTTSYTGRAIQLDDARSVGAFRTSEKQLVLRFKNGERMTEIALSQEAANAVLLLLLNELDGPVA